MSKKPNKPKKIMFKGMEVVCNEHICNSNLFTITTKNGKKIVISINEIGEYVLIHTGTTISDVSFSKLLSVKISELNLDGTVYKVDLKI